MKIEEAIQQKKFRSEHQKAIVNILFTASWLGQQSARGLRPYGISPEQFNILRILRGRYPKPATVKDLTERMLDKSSNASRLVDKLKTKGLVDRQECPEDRRRVDVVITDAGLALLEKASVFMEKEMEARLDGITDAEAAEISRLLDKMRGE